MRTSLPAVARSIVSPVVAVVFGAVASSGILMLLHVRSGALKELHEGAGIALAVAGLIHLTLNWRALTGLFRYRRAFVACALAAVLSLALFVTGAAEPKHDRRFGPAWQAPAGQRGEK